MTRFVKGLAPLLGALLVAGCEHAVGGESPYQGHSYIVGIDISGSRTKTDLDESRKLLDDLIDRLQAGDRLTLIEVYQGGREPARQWSDSVRTPRNGEVTGSDRRRLDDFKAIARIQTSILFDSVRAKEIQSTDIFGTLARAADYAKASRNRRHGRACRKCRRSEEHTSELQSPDHLVCRLLLEKKKKKIHERTYYYTHPSN